MRFRIAIFSRFKICVVLNLIINQLIALVIPAIKLADLLTYLLGGMLSGKLSHSLEVGLSACRGHIKQELFGKAAVLNVLQDLFQIGRASCRERV